MNSRAERDRRRRRAVAMRSQDMTVRAIATALGVSHVTIIRDLRAYDQAEAELVLAALTGEPQRQDKAPPRLNTQQWLDAHRSKYYRW